MTRYCAALPDFVSALERERIEDVRTDLLDVVNRMCASPPLGRQYGWSYADAAIDLFRGIVARATGVDQDPQQVGKASQSHLPGSGVASGERPGL